MPVFTLPERCDRAAAEALLPDLIEALGSGTVTIDASAVTQVGQSALQLIASARKSHVGLQINGSAAFEDAARLSGLAEFFCGTDAP